MINKWCKPGKKTVKKWYTPGKNGKINGKQLVEIV